MFRRTLPSLPSNRLNVKTLLITSIIMGLRSRIGLVIVSFNVDAVVARRDVCGGAAGTGAASSKMSYTHVTLII